MKYFVIYVLVGCVCIASGDPHFKTFDGQSLPYQGMCKYVLARPIETPDDPECWFAAEVKNEPRYGSTQVSYVRLVDLFTFGLQIRLHQNKEVLVSPHRLVLQFYCPIVASKVILRHFLIIVGGNNILSVKTHPHRPIMDNSAC